MQDCSMLVPSGMISIKVRASSRLEDALHAAKEYAQ